MARRRRNQERDRRSAFSKRVLRQVRGFIGQNPFGQLDPARMIRVLDLCARGVYLYERLKPLKLPLRVASLDYDLPGDPKKSDRLATMRSSFDEEMNGCEFKGSNPNAFRYAICEKPEKGVTMIEMLFFGELRRWAFYHPDSPRQNQATGV